MNDPQRLGVLLQRRGWQISVAESLTAGNLQALLASVSGASRWFAGGITAYNIDQKVRLLGVDREHAASCGCVSARVAREMAAGARAKLQTPIAAATTGYAEPWGEVAVPMAHCAVDIEGQIWLSEFQGPGLDRQGVQRAVADFLLSRILSALQEQGG